MKNFQINEIEILTGLKAHTLRAWERRHNLLTPGRTTGNIRLYSIEDLDRIFHLYALSKSGYKISAIATLDQAQLVVLLDQVSSAVLEKQGKVHQLVIAMYRLDSDEFSSILQSGLIKWGMTSVLSDIVFPFLLKTGLLWNGNGLTHEHLAVTIIRSKIILGIEQALSHKQKSKDALLFLPEIGQFDLLLLYLEFLLKSNVIRTFNMGSDVKLFNLGPVIQLRQPDFIFTYLPARARFDLDGLSSIMQKFSPRSRLVIIKHPTNRSLPGSWPNVIFISHDEVFGFIERMEH